MTDAATQLRRLLEVIPRLNDGQAHSLTSVAKLIRTEPEAVLHDLLALSNRFGDPGGFIPGLQVYIEGRDAISVQAPQFKRPMGLIPAERCALELGLAMLRTECTPQDQQTIDRARARLRRTAVRTSADPTTDPQHYAAIGSSAPPEQLATVRRGVKERRKLRIAYRSATSDEFSTRTVCPYCLVATRGSWYLVAYSEKRKAIRTFRVDRIEDATLIAERFEVPESFSADSVVRDGRVFQSETPETLRIRYSAKIARWIAEREHAVPEPDGSVVVDYPLADVRCAVRHGLQYGPEAEVLAPESVREAVVNRLKEIVGRATTS